MNSANGSQPFQRQACLGPQPVPSVPRSGLCGSLAIRAVAGQSPEGSGVCGCTLTQKPGDLSVRRVCHQVPGKLSHLPSHECHWYPVNSTLTAPATRRGARGPRPLSSHWEGPGRAAPLAPSAAGGSRWACGCWHLLGEPLPGLGLGVGAEAEYLEKPTDLSPSTAASW